MVEKERDKEQKVMKQLKIRHAARRFCVSVGTLLVAANAWAATWYVNGSSGANGNSGLAASSAKATIQAAVAGGGSQEVRVATHYDTVYATVGQPLLNPDTGGEFVDNDFCDIDNYAGEDMTEEATITISGFPRWLTWDSYVFAQSGSWDKTKRVRRNWSEATPWYDGGNYYTFHGTPTKAGEWTLEITASWDDGVSQTVSVRLVVQGANHTVTFNANGGSVSPATRNVAHGSAIGTLPTPTRDGYAFVGWFARASGGTRATSATKVTRSVTYYAHWTEVVVPVEGSERLSATFDGLAKRTFGGLAFDADGNMAGLVQLATAKAAKDGSVSVKGFVMLEDGKKQTVKAAKGTVQDGLLTVRTAIGKIGALDVTFGDDGFVGKLGEGTVASADVGEDTGILRGTIRLSYLDAKTGVLKTRQMTLTGLTDNSDAVGTLSVKGKEPQTFQAVVE